MTGLPVGALVVPTSTHENRTTEQMLERLTQQGVTDRLELVLVDRGVTETAARKLGSDYDLELRRVGWDDKQPRSARFVVTPQSQRGRSRPVVRPSPARHAQKRLLSQRTSASL